MKARPVEILLVEDNPGDVLLTREAMKDAKVANHLSVVQDGVEALAFMRRQGAYAEVPRPDLVLLDLNLPRKSGLEVLVEMKADAVLRRIPVVVLTTSESERDILAAYDHHVNAYVTKPVDLEQFHKVVHAIEKFWFMVVQLPVQ